jgi:ubiquinone/menaquinone biosynthesis C-methylase UbiE
MSDARTDAARTHFDRWSRSYERDRVSRWLAQLQSEALAELELVAEDTLLDIGCGTGAAVRQAGGTVRRAVGVDLSPAMIARARELAAGLDNVSFQEGDVGSSLPFADGEFTAVLCTTAFHHFARPLETIAEIARVLAPGGRLVIGDANRDHLAVRVLDVLLRLFQRSHVGFRSPAQISADLRAARFARVRVKTTLNGGYALVRADRVAQAAAA